MLFVYRALLHHALQLSSARQLDIRKKSKLAATAPSRAREEPSPGRVLMPRKKKARAGKKECISRESGPGHIDGNDVFYH